jgi:hypothetical protein
MTTPGPTLADAKGKKKLWMLRQRSAHINEQIAELLGKKLLIWWEILQIWTGDLVARVKRVV